MSVDSNTWCLDLGGGCWKRGTFPDAAYIQVLKKLDSITHSTHPNLNILRDLTQLLKGVKDEMLAKKRVVPDQYLDLKESISLCRRMILAYQTEAIDKIPIKSILSNELPPLIVNGRPLS